MVKAQFLVLGLVACGSALCAELKINSASDLIDFSNNVNNGTNYFGTTVFLDADIDFSGGLSEQFEPIGTSESIFFQGTFEGQGYT